jgi:hypothetical protein
LAPLRFRQCFAGWLLSLCERGLGMYTRAPLLTIFAARAHAHQRGFIIPACIFHEDLSLQLFRECACESDCSFYLHSHISSRRFFRCFSLPAQAHTHTPFYFEMHARCARGNEARSAGQKTMTPVGVCSRTRRSLAFNRRLCHYYFLLGARASVVREQKKQRLVAQRQ